MKLLPAAGQSSRPLSTDQLMESVTKRRVTDDEIAQQIQMQRAEQKPWPGLSYDPEAGMKQLKKQQLRLKKQRHRQCLE